MCVSSVCKVRIVSIPTAPGWTPCFVGWVVHYTLSLFLFAGCPSNDVPVAAWIIAVPIVVGLLVLGFLAILLVRLLLFLLVRPIVCLQLLCTGTLMMLWILLVVQDRYEYQQFKKEVGQSQFGPVCLGIVAYPVERPNTLCMGCT